eukprot:scaffold31870_cov37-Prasinocladus_malaysianus.AAC.1
MSHDIAQTVSFALDMPRIAQALCCLGLAIVEPIVMNGQYLHHKEVKAAQGIKISAQGLENAVAGTSLHVVGPDDDLDELKEEVMGDIESIFDSIEKGGEGVYVQASTLGSLEALLSFLKTDAVQIPVSAINIGPVHKKDVMRAGVMIEKKMKKFATILAFDVPVSREAAELAEEMGVKIMTADIIYHLFDQFTEYLKQVQYHQPVMPSCRCRKPMLRYDVM